MEQSTIFARSRRPLALLTLGLLVATLGFLAGPIPAGAEGGVQCLSGRQLLPPLAQAQQPASGPDAAVSSTYTAQGSLDCPATGVTGVPFFPSITGNFTLSATTTFPSVCVASACTAVPPISTVTMTITWNDSTVSQLSGVGTPMASADPTHPALVAADVTVSQGKYANATGPLVLAFNPFTTAPDQPIVELYLLER